MVSTYLTIAISVIMGFSVFLSMPIVFYKKLSARNILFLNALAAGILVFLLMDIYGDVAAIFGNSTISNPLELLFLAAFVIMFLFFVLPKGSRDPEENPKRTSVLAAIGIGLQNLTEGLVFGSSAAAGALSIYVISAIGFTLQNMTEGFPIAAPLLGSKTKMEKKFVSAAFLISGIPTIIGTIIGLVFFSDYFIVLFDAFASAAILYVVLVLFHVNIIKAKAGSKEETVDLNWLSYMGILVGFSIAFIVNYLVVA